MIADMCDVMYQTEFLGACGMVISRFMRVLGAEELKLFSILL